MTLTKADIIDAVVSGCGVSRADAEFLSQMFFDKIKQSLSSGEDVLLSGFGKWSIKNKTARKGRNPHTGETMKLEARTVVTWKYSSHLRDALNENA
jgi:integration host factor subunit alpha